MSEYFPQSKPLGGNVKIELDFTNYAKNGDLRITVGVDTSEFGKILI